MDLNSQYIWDDSELLKWYESGNNKSYSERVTETDINIGQVFRVQYDQDQIDYEAVIAEIQNEKSVTVRFLGYNNMQIVTVSDLKPSFGLIARRLQELQSKISTDGKQNIDFKRTPYPKPSNFQLDSYEKVQNYVSKHIKSFLK